MARLLPSPSLDAWHSGRVHLSPCVSLHLSPVVSPPGCLARLSGWTRSFVSLGSLVSLCLPSFVSRCLLAWMIQSGWTGSFVSLCHLSPVVSQPGCLARLSGWTGSFVSLCLPSFVDAWRGSGSFVSLCLPSFVSRCLPAWMPGWTGSLVSLCLPSFVARCLPAWIWHGSLGGRVHVSPFVPFICLPVSPSLDAWHGSLGGRVHLSPFVSLDFSRCLPAWMPGTALWVGVHLSPFVSLHLSPVVLAWMPGAALWVDGFICLPLSPRMSGTPLFPFICLPLSPSLDAWHCFFGGQTHFSPFVSLHLAPVVSQPGCLSRLSRRTDSLVSLVPLHLSPISVGGRIHLFPFVSLYLSPVVSQPGCLARLSGWTDSFVSRCLPAWMCGTHAPRFPSLPAVLSFWRGLVCLRLWPWLRSFLVLWMLGTGSSFVCPSSGLLGLVVGRLPCLSLATPCLFVQCLVISCGPELTIAVRCGARLQLREGSVNPPVKQT